MFLFLKIQDEKLNTHAPKLSMFLKRYWSNRQQQFYHWKYSCKLSASLTIDWVWTLQILPRILKQPNNSSRTRFRVHSVHTTSTLRCLFRSYSPNKNVTRVRVSHVLALFQRYQISISHSQQSDAGSGFKSRDSSDSRRKCRRGAQPNFFPTLIKIVEFHKIFLHGQMAPG